MNHQQLDKSKVYHIHQIIEYITNSVISRTILEKPTGNIRVLSFDDKEGLAKKNFSF